MIEGPFGALFFCPQGSRPAGFFASGQDRVSRARGRHASTRGPGARRRHASPPTDPPPRRKGNVSKRTNIALRSGPSRKEMLVSVLTLGTGTAPSPCSEKRIDCSEAGRRMMARKCLISLAKVPIVRMFFYSEYTYIG